MQNRPLKFKKKLNQYCLVLSLGFVISLPAQAQVNKTVGLLDVYQMAAAQDAKLAQAKAQYQSDQQGLNTALAALLPQIQADASYFVTDSSIDTSDVTSKEVSLTLNQSLYRHETWAGYEQVKRLVEQAKYKAKSAEQDLILRVSEGYFKALLAEETLNLFSAKEASDKKQLARATASAEVGLASKVDVLQAQSSYDLSRSDRLSAENNLDISREELTKLTGQSLLRLKPFPLMTELPTPILDATSLESQAERHNLLVKQAGAQVAFANEEIEVQKGGYWPAVNLQAKVSDSHYSDFSSAQFRDSQKTSVGITVSVPLYSGGGTSSNVSSARYKATAAREGLRDAQETARLNARIQVRNLTRGVSLIEALGEAVKSNNAFVEAAEEGYRVGLKSLLEVLTARSNQVAAHKNLLEAIHNQVLNSLRLESILGDLTPDDLTVFDALLHVPPVKVGSIQ